MRLRPGTALTARRAYGARTHARTRQLARSPSPGTGPPRPMRCPQRGAAAFTRAERATEEGPFVDVPVPFRPGSTWTGAIHTSSMIDSTGTETTVGPLLEADLAAAASVSLLQVVADPVRWSVLQQLVRGRACVCSLQEHLPIAANLLSYHLKVLRESGLVTTSRRGRWIDYALADDALARMRSSLPGLPAPGRVRP